jgi:hypothetical protein
MYNPTPPITTSVEKRVVFLCPCQFTAVPNCTTVLCIVGCCYIQRNVEVFLSKNSIYLKMNLSPSNQQLIQIY